MSSTDRTAFVNASGISTENLVSQLRAVVQGRVITPDNTEYDTARTVFYGGFDRRPAAIVRVANAADVSQVVSLARETGTELAVRSGGHSVAGYGVSHGGIVIDLGDMKALDIDVAGRTAWAETGLTTGEYTTAAGAHGLATGFGDTGSVGIGGITLGGGVGYLVRKYGLTIDDLLGAEIVTADGQIRQVNAESHPDLFWAIRGGGGNFGVVTRFHFRLHEVPSIVGGMLVLPASPEILRAFVDAMAAAPEELSGIVNVMIAPPMPFLPPEYHGKLITFGLLAYAGDAEAGERAMAPFRAIAKPLADMLAAQPYTALYPPEEGEYHPVAAARTMFLDEIGQSDIDAIFKFLGESNANMAVAQIRVLGGAMARVPVDATAFAHRNRKIMANVAALYDKPEDAAKHETWAGNFAQALHKGKAGAYVNFLGAEGATRVREAYPGATWDRLTKIKAQYDPTNLFRLNQNIPPAQ